MPSWAKVRRDKGQRLSPFCGLDTVPSTADGKLWGVGFIPTLEMRRLRVMKVICQGHAPWKGCIQNFKNTLTPRVFFLKLFARQSMATNPNISKSINTQNDMIRGRSLNRSQASLKITLLVRTLPLYLWTSAYLGLKKIHQIPPSPPSILKRDNWKVSRLIQRDSPTIFTQKDNCSQLNSL